jgi:zinc-binding alcohol dehydrogenase/oxidoreductase
MKALVLDEVKKAPVLKDWPDPKAEKGQVIVKLKAAALNRRDYWITQGLYPGIKCPVISGSDGAGIVEETGDEVDTAWKGKEVVINPGYNWGEREEVQCPDFKILGMPDDGTFAEAIVVSQEQLFPKPGHLNWQEAAALPLAGLTAYRALIKQGKLKTGQTVVITGIGGGVASMALQFAVAAGATVIVTSSSQAKVDRAVSIGAAAGFLYTADDYASKLRAEYGSAQLIIDGTGGDGFGNLVDIVAPGGRIVNYGATAGVSGGLELRKIFWKQLHLVGSTMGSPDDFRDMLDMVNKYKIKPVIHEVFPLSKGSDAFELMKVSSQFGKLVLSICGELGTSYERDR